MSIGPGAAPALVAIDPPLDGPGPRVSVVMSVFNNEPYLAQAIDSVLAQELGPRYELIVADDCSSDGTPAILQDYKRRFPARIRLALARQNTSGVVSFREAVRASRAEFIALIDGDDFWVSRDKLQKQVAFLDAHRECSMCFHNVIAYYEDESNEPFDYRPPQAFLNQRDLLERNYIVSCAPLIRTAILQALPDWVFALELGDWALYVMAAAQGNVGYLDEIMGAYRIHEAGSWSKLGRRRQLEGSIRFYQEMRNRLGDTHAELIERQQKVCCGELRTYAWTAWSAGDRPESLRAWAALAEHDPLAWATEFAYRFGQAAQAQPPPGESVSGEPRYEGYQDAVNASAVSGWAWDALRPDAPVAVEILDGDSVIATVLADTYRHDLQAAGKGRGYHAFAHRLPESLRDGQPHRICTRIAGTDFLLAHGGTIVAFANPRGPDQRRAMRSAEVQWLERDLERGRAAADQLKVDLVGRNRQIVELRRALEKTRSAIAGLRGQLVARYDEAQRLDSHLASAREIETLLKQVDTLTAELSDARRKQESMMTPFGWRLGGMVRSLVRWLTGRSRRG